MRMRYIISCSLLYFSALSHKRNYFRKKKVTEHKMCVLIFCTTLSETFLILRRGERDMIKNVYWSPCKVPIILVRFLMKLEFYRQMFEKHANIKFHGNLSSGSRIAPCGLTDGQTDMTKLIVAFRNFANAPKMEIT